MFPDNWQREVLGLKLLFFYSKQIRFPAKISFSPTDWLDKEIVFIIIAGQFNLLSEEVILQGDFR